MKKHRLSFGMLAAMLLMAFTFVACGGDDNDDTPVIDPMVEVPSLLPTEDGMYHDNTLIYRITDEQAQEVEVVHPVDFSTCSKAEIPESVNINGEHYAVTAIADYAFAIYDEFFNGYKYNNVLESISFSHSVKRIGKYAFFCCSALKSIFIPKEVTEIGVGTFSADDALEEIIVQEGNPLYDSRQGCNAIIETKENRLVYGCKTSVIPNGIKTIGHYAFWNCIGLTEIDIPSSVTSIEEGSFYICENLKKVTCRNTTPPALEDDVFKWIDEECILYVPDRSVDKYLSQWPFKSGYVKAFGISVDR